MGGDGAHVPDHGALGIEIGCDHEQASAAAMLGSDVGEQSRRCLFDDQVLERPRIDKALRRRTGFENVPCRDLGVGVAQRLVIA